jgi:hypothetical protein
VEITGTVYGLVDPRTEQVRYIGATIQTLSVRLAGHLSSGAAWRARHWVEELKTAGHAPTIVALQENVPLPRLLAAENDEITRRIVAGGELLNEAGTAKGRGIDLNLIAPQLPPCHVGLVRASAGAAFPVEADDRLDTNDPAQGPRQPAPSSSPRSANKAKHRSRSVTAVPGRGPRPECDHMGPATPP